MEERAAGEAAVRSHGFVRVAAEELRPEEAGEYKFPF